MLPDATALQGGPSKGRGEAPAPPPAAPSPVVRYPSLTVRDRLSKRLPGEGALPATHRTARLKNTTREWRPRGTQTAGRMPSPFCPAAISVKSFVPAPCAIRHPRVIRPPRSLHESLPVGREMRTGGSPLRASQTLAPDADGPRRRGTPARPTPRVAPVREAAIALPQAPTSTKAPSQGDLHGESLFHHRKPPPHIGAGGLP